MEQDKKCPRLTAEEKEEQEEERREQSELSQTWITLSQCGSSEQQSDPWLRRSAAIRAWESWAQSDPSTPETAVAADEQQVFKRVRFLLTPEIVFIEASVPLMQKAPPPVAALHVGLSQVRAVCDDQGRLPLTAVATVLEQKSAAAAAEQQIACNNLQPAAAASLRSDGRTTVYSRNIIQIKSIFLSGGETCSPMSILF